jgi:hypothetical protein
MVIYVSIKGERLLALLDTVSTHNFIQVAMLRRLGLPLSGGDQLRVTVANGDRLPCVGVAQGVEVSIAGAPYTIMCVWIDLGCFDFILGVDFLCTLGPITWDFDARTLAFQRDGWPVVWHAAPGPGAPRPTAAIAAATSEQPMLDRLLPHHAAIFEEPQGLPPVDRTTTASTYCRVPHPSPSGRTSTPSRRRTSWSARSRACSRKASSARARPRSPL